MAPTPTPTPTLRDAALDYIARGFAIKDGPAPHPRTPAAPPTPPSCSCPRMHACPTPGKHARQGWGEPTRETLTPEEVNYIYDPRRVAGITPLPNIFIVAYLSDLVIADIDDPDRWNYATKTKGLPAPPTLTSRRGDNFHLYYRKTWDHSGPPPSLQAHQTLPYHSGQVRWRAIVAAPPSLHRTGTHYAFDDLDHPIAPAPDWLSATTTQNPPHPRPVPHPNPTAHAAATQRWTASLTTAWAQDVRRFAALPPTYAPGDPTRNRPGKGFGIAADAGRLVALGLLSYDDALQALIQAATSNGWVHDATLSDVQRQLTRGLDTGLANPAPLATDAPHAPHTTEKENV